MMRRTCLMNDPGVRSKSTSLLGDSEEEGAGKQTRPETYHNRFWLDPSVVSTDDDESQCLVKASGTVEKALRFRGKVRRKEQGNRRDPSYRLFLQLNWKPLASKVSCKVSFFQNSLSFFKNPWVFFKVLEFFFEVLDFLKSTWIFSGQYGNWVLLVIKT